MIRQTDTDLVDSVRPKLLAVDDSAINIRLIHDMFSSDFDVFMATNGLQAIAKAHELLPDLILLDVVMPGMDGFEVCQKLKADPQTAHIPVIFVTGAYDEADEVRGFELGGADFIHKPVNPIITRARVQTQLALKRQADRLRQIALIDGLTGVANRRQFDRQLDSSWRHCQREKLPLTLLMIDVDYFKRFNDHYGHQMGDSCLQLVARAIRKALNRPQDLVARYGGEEFVCILPDTDARGGARVAENLLDAVRALRIDHAQSDVAKCVTVSIGMITRTPASNADTRAVIEAADQQLYTAKKAGRAQYHGVELVD